MEKDENTSVAVQIGDLALKAMDWVGDEPFRLFVLLALILSGIMLRLAKDQNAWFKIVICLLLFVGVSAVGFVALKDVNGTQIEKTDDTLPTVPNAAVSLTEPRDVGRNETSEPTTDLDSFNNQQGFRLQRPEQYSDARSWFAYVGAFSDRDRAIRHARKIHSDFPNVGAIAFLDGARKSWVVALATWTSRENAEEAAQFGRAAGIEASSYPEKFSKNLFDANPRLYYFSSLE